MMVYDGLVMVYDGLGANTGFENYVCPQVFLNPKSFFIPQTIFLFLYVFPMHSIGLRREWVGVYNSVWGLRFCCYRFEPQIELYTPILFRGTYIECIGNLFKFIIIFGV